MPRYAGAKPGSWLPLPLMLTIFCAKFAVGVIIGMQLPLAGTAAFASVVSLVYGLLGGMFLGRAVVIWRAAQPTSHGANT